MTYYDWGIAALLMILLLVAAFYSKSKSKGVLISSWPAAKSENG